MELAEPVRTPLPSSRETARTEEDGMLREDGVREVLARLQRGERIKAIARDLGVARNTVKRWQRLGLAPAAVGTPPQSDRSLSAIRGTPRPRSELERPGAPSGTADVRIRGDLPTSATGDSAAPRRSRLGDRGDCAV